MAKTKFVTAEGTAVKEVRNEAGEVVTAGYTPRTVECEYNFGETVEEAIELFGKEVVFSAFLAAAKVDAQSLVRRKLKTNVPAVEGVSAERPYTDAEIQEALSQWKPGVKAERAAASVTDKAEALLTKMTEAQKAEFLEKLMAMAQ